MTELLETLQKAEDLAQIAVGAVEGDPGRHQVMLGAIRTATALAKSIQAIAAKKTETASPAAGAQAPATPT